ncbi:uncharacterized protein J4E88_005964 [Alternaria novae-zelandiae]|uniref:uncharacterized protein n=1 Tax=Alternaria novae-zelandiae TaxID=430562 RepID=UPI0020C328C5|nr:uncharacterized protein J4E88_005964 [Alternaria novae-zelandiae]KAI4680073.1 hypothetical protein J4E88_005964 [Alternaria novae-zelandiae]
MSASIACKPQQAGFFSRFRRTDSVMGSPTGSATPSLAPSLASLSQDNDNLAATNTRLQNRNQELTQQSELNQLLFHQTSEALIEKESELVELKEKFRDNAEATNETIQALGEQLQTLTEQLEESQDKATAREVQLVEQIDRAQDTATDRDAQLADSEEQQHQLSLEAAHVQSPTQEDVDDLIWAKLQDRNKTIHFLRCRQAKSDKRIQKLQERLEVEQSVGRDWVETIMMVNMKVRARAREGNDADAGV